jgi:hypothetical protein
VPVLDNNFNAPAQANSPIWIGCGEHRSAFLKEWGRVKVLVLVAWLVSSVAGAWGCGVFVSMGCRVPHQGSSI